MTLEVSLRVSERRDSDPIKCGWHVELEGDLQVPPYLVAPLTDHDLDPLRAEHGVPQTWRDLLAHMSPNEAWRPGIATLRAVGDVLFQRLLQPAQEALADVESRATQRLCPIRFRVEVDPGSDPVLRYLPLELLWCHGFLFKRPARGQVRTAPHGERRHLNLQPGTRVLVVTAHKPGLAPDPEDLEGHAASLCAAARGLGWVPVWLDKTTAPSPADLERALTREGPWGILYVVAHGQRDPDHAGRLWLAGGDVTGDELGRWLEGLAVAGRQVQLAVLCACSSAAPEHDAYSSGMAQYLAQPKRALGALGFRARVDVDWALDLMKDFFSEFGKQTPPEEAFSRARLNRTEGDPQWALPVLYLPRPPCASAAPAAPQGPRPGEGLPALDGRLRPRKRFLGREGELARLTDWVVRPGTAVLSALHGQGGIGKTELANELAHRSQASGRAVLWLEQPDRDVRGALLSLLRARDPRAQVDPNVPLEALQARVRDQLGPYAGLLVLDDVARAADVGLLVPGDAWNVLVTTRAPGLLPGVDTLELGPLPKPDAVRLLARVAWSCEEPPDHERADVDELVEKLGRTPLLLELAAQTLRRKPCPVREYRSSLAAQDAHAADDLKRFEEEVIERSLASLEAEDRRVFDALAVLPSVGVEAKTVALCLGDNEPPVTRRLQRLARASLTTLDPERARYRLHPVVWQLARARVRQDPSRWNALHSGAGKALLDRVIWAGEALGRSVEAARLRWDSVRDLVDSLDPGPWKEGAPGAECIAAALANADVFLAAERAPSHRAAALETALSLASDPFVKATALERRGNLQQQLGDIGAAEADYGAALPLFKAEGSRLGQANVLNARGNLRRIRGNLLEAANDYDAALALFEAEGNRLCQANVLHARGNLRRQRGDLCAAEADYEAALGLFKAVDNRLGQANSLKVRGDLRGRRGDLRAAEEDYEAALALFRAVQDRLGQANVLLARGNLRRQRRDLSDAADDYDAALALFRAVEDRFGEANILRSRGVLRQERGEISGAEADYEAALALFKAVEDRLGQANVLYARGYLRMQSKDYSRAAADYEAALARFKAVENRLGQANVLQARGDLAKARSYLERARSDYEAALPLYEAVADAWGLSTTLAELAVLAGMTQDAARAADYATRGLAIGTRCQNAYATRVCKRVLAGRAEPPEDAARPDA